MRARMRGGVSRIATRAGAVPAGGRCEKAQCLRWSRRWPMISTPPPAVLRRHRRGPRSTAPQRRKSLSRRAATSEAKVCRLDLPRAPCSSRPSHRRCNTKGPRSRRCRRALSFGKIRFGAHPKLPMASVLISDALALEPMVAITCYTQGHRTNVTSTIIQFTFAYFKCAYGL